VRDYECTLILLAAGADTDPCDKLDQRGLFLSVSHLVKDCDHGEAFSNGNEFSMKQNSLRSKTRERFVQRNMRHARAKIQTNNNVSPAL